MTEEEHRFYHGEVALEGCGVDGCTFNLALALHFEYIYAGEPEDQEIL